MQIKTLTTHTLMYSLFAISAASFAGDHDHHDHGSHAAHVHGEAVLRLVGDNDKLTFQLESPAMNIVGFEHAPKSKEQHKSLAQAIETLNKPEALITFDGTECSFISTRLDNPFKDAAKHAKHDHDEHKHGHDKHEHDEHKDSHHEHKHKHKHDEHKHDEHKHGHDEHKHEEHKEEHREFVAEYQAQCKQIDNLKGINFTLLKEFKGIEKLDVQYILFGKQGATTLNSSTNTLSVTE